MKKKNGMLLLALLALGFALVSCDKEEGFLKVSDVETKNGSVKGSVKGMLGDGEKLDESFNLKVSRLGRNYVYYGSYDTTLYINNSSSIVGSQTYSASVSIDINKNAGEYSLDDLDLDISKVVDGSWLALNFDEAGEDALVLSDCVFNADNGSLSGKIKGPLTTSHYDSTGKRVEGICAVDLTFNVTTIDYRVNLYTISH
jgi:hypothetical protein